MAIEALNNFNQILNTLNFQAEDKLLKEKGMDGALLPGQEDTLQLSLQAQKALNQKQADIGQSLQEITPQPEATTQIDAQGNRVQISPQGTELASSQASKVAWETSAKIDDAANAVEAPKNVVGTATLDSGAKVSIYTTQFTNGDETSSISGNSEKVIAEITRADGTSEKFAINSNTVISEDNDGNLIFNAISDSSNINGTAKNDVIINLTGSANINCGEGDDTIISFSNIDNLYLGDGNNTVKTNKNSITPNIYANDGNNSIQINNNVKTNIEVGNGDNNIESLASLNIVGGNGNNKVNIKGSDTQYSESSLSFGEGDNIINITGRYNFVKNMNVGDGDNNISIDAFVTSSLTVGDGKNNISIGRNTSINTLNPLTGDIQNIPGASEPLSLRYTEINIGDGDNSLDFYWLYGHTNIGNGNNNISSYTGVSASFITFGNGNNTLTTTYLNSSSLNFGSGNNTINAQSIHGGLAFGDGNNTINAESLFWGTIATGTGNNNFNFDHTQYAGLRMGSGHDLINISSYSTSSYINLGSGNDKLNINGSFNNSTLITGDGEDNINIDGDVNSSKIILGAETGNTSESRDTLKISGNISYSSIVSKNRLNQINIDGTLIESLIERLE